MIFLLVVIAVLLVMALQLLGIRIFFKEANKKTILIVVGIFVVWLAFKMANGALTASFEHKRTQTKPIYNVKPIDANVPDTLPYIDYINLKDSIATIRNIKNGDDKKMDVTRFSYFGVANSISCDTCSMAWYKNMSYGDERHVQYYFNLYGWSLANPAIIFGTDTFYVDKGQAYIRKHYKETSTLSGTTYVKGKVADYPVKFRYSHLGKYIMIPITKQQAETWAMVFKILKTVFYLYWAFLAFWFLRFIYDISRGNAFIKRNVLFLTVTAISLIGYVFLTSELSYLTRFILKDYFTNDIIIKRQGGGAAFGFMAGVALLLIVFAFSKAKKLKEEQDLTI